MLTTDQSLYPHQWSKAVGTNEDANGNPQRVDYYDGQTLVFHHIKTFNAAEKMTSIEVVIDKQ